MCSTGGKACRLPQLFQAGAEVSDFALSRIERDVCYFMSKGKMQGTKLERLTMTDYNI